MNDIIEADFTINPYLQKMRVNPIANNGKGKYLLCESGDKLYFRVWESSNQKKIIVALHGMGAHSEYYIQVADQLINDGISVYALDVKHHGLSTGKKGDLKKFKEILYQIHEFISTIREKNKGIPIFMIGLSMGGMLTVNYSALYPEDLVGIILMAPGVSGNFKLKASDIAKLPLLIFAFIFAKGKPVVNVAKRAAITSRNPLRIKYQENDELRIKVQSPRFLLYMGINVKRAFKNAVNITNPTLIMQGTDDQLVSRDGVKEFFDNIPIQDKEFIELEGAYHSLYSDPAMVEQKGWEKLRNWILDH
jgi:alpha-beta hydrolase superfamily lysophospholipase